MLLLSCSDPSVSIVAPHGAVEGRFTPNPIAAGWPTDNMPVILDVCPSTTTNGMVARMARTGGRMAGPWLIDRAGNATDDPHVVMTRSPPARSCRSAERISAIRATRSAFWARR